MNVSLSRSFSGLTSGVVMINGLFPYGKTGDKLMTCPKIERSRFFAGAGIFLKGMTALAVFLLISRIALNIGAVNSRLTIGG